MICEVCNKTKATCARRSLFSENLFFSCQECADKGWLPYGMTVRYCVEQLSKPEHLQKPMLVKRLLLENQIKADIIEAQKMVQGLLTDEQSCGIQPCAECNHLPTLVERWDGFHMYDYLCGKVYGSAFKTMKEAIDDWNDKQLKREDRGNK